MSIAHKFESILTFSVMLMIFGIYVYFGEKIKMCKAFGS